MKKENIEYKHYNIYARDYSKFTTESFRDDVSLQNFANKFDSVHDQFNSIQFNSIFSGNLKVVLRHAPIKKLKSKEIKLKNKPWITDRIMKMINIRNKFYLLVKKDNLLMLKQ